MEMYSWEKYPRAGWDYPIEPPLSEDMDDLMDYVVGRAEEFTDEPVTIGECQEVLKDRGMWDQDFTDDAIDDLYRKLDDFVPECPVYEAFTRTNGVWGFGIVDHDPY